MAVERTCTVAVLGGGPAGVTLAVDLARSGIPVALVTVRRPGGRIEGLSDRVAAGLEAHGLEHARAAMGAMVRRRVAWGTPPEARNSEYVTARDAFNDALLADAEQAGVTVIRLGRGGPECERLPEGAGWRVACLPQAGAPCTLEARFLVEARGRAAPKPAAWVRRGPETTALVTEAEIPDTDSFTMVEAFGDGWAWSVAAGGRAVLQIFVDSAGGLPKRGGLEALFADCVKRLSQAGREIGSAGWTMPPQARNATPYLSRPLIADDAIRIGDAALAVDPLSGHGVFEALGSALAGAATVRTMLRAPKRSALARRFFTERAELAFMRYARVGRDFYRLCDAFADRPFWRARRDWPDGVPAHEAAGSGEARIVRRPVNCHGLIVERRVCVTPDQPRGIWMIDGVEIAALCDLLRDRQGEPAGAALEAARQALGVSPGALDTAIAWLGARRLLEPGERISLRPVASE
ncbi:FAD-dependent oxidoreductase [Kaustia mangrovi]|uniref:FAD-dependent oxidoreductase n=1 Tax=Kaustia mangrovi TaxID=2593653 RepID=A0A7S8C3W2_9HYPH|nr:FAD-dependent monooxygenase [Kaustia mangrovi]QPC42876.1 FAD-dependent oxidoreductase [Kaustia mangrovi]